MLTHSQRRLLNQILSYIERHQVAPTMEELRVAVGQASKSSVHRTLEALEQRGYIRRIKHRARALEVLKGPDDEPVTVPTGGPPQRPPIEIPVLGYVAAGTPFVVWEDIHSYVLVSPTVVRKAGAHYALRVRGESMVGAGICDGDIVIIRQQQTAADGEIVVALIDQQETTLKRLRRDPETDEVVLIAENPEFPEMRLPPDRVSVQGRLTGLQRVY